MKQNLIAVVAIFIAWSIMDILIHGFILRSLYAASSELWRPEDEMRMGLMRIVVFIQSVTFVLVYSLYFREKTLSTGIKYGALFGIGAGISMGYGTFSVQPIPYHLALGWFLGTLAEAIVAGAILGAVFQKLSSSDAVSPSGS